MKDPCTLMSSLPCFRLSPVVHILPFAHMSLWRSRNIEELLVSTLQQVASTPDVVINIQSVTAVRIRGL